MADGLNTVPVLEGHLEELERTLSFVEGVLVALDLQAEYRQMGTVSKPTPLTRDVVKQLARVRGYLRQEDDDVEVE